MIENRIIGTELINWQDIQELQPSNLKNGTEYRDKLKALIRKHGFAKAFDGWRDGNDVVWMIDGHQRKESLRELKEEGENIQDLLPVTLIDAQDRKEAIKILLDVHNTRQSEINESVLIEFLETEEIKTEEIEIEEIRTEKIISSKDEDLEEKNHDFKDGWFLHVEFDTEIECSEWYERMKENNLNCKIIQ